jgi:hypothetical protein
MKYRTRIYYTEADKATKLNREAPEPSNFPVSRDWAYVHDVE